jgi:antitoxin component YwqK of YwqJK toxin-antitoxin module
MKIRILLLFLVAFLCNSCTTKIVEETIESYPDGTPKIVRYYKDNGSNRTLFKETLYYSNHQKYMEGEYKNGKRNGKWTSWFQNGNEMSIHNFVNDVDDGNMTVFYENGKKRYQGKYTKGKKIGVWKFWDEKGTLLNKEDYDK